MPIRRYKSEIAGHLDIVVIENEDDTERKTSKGQEILIHGDPEGLSALARLLTRIAELDQESINDLPIGAREHIHLRPNIDLSKSSVEVIAGRLDAKGTGSFYPMYVAKGK